MKKFYQSYKFWYAVGGAALVLIAHLAGLPLAVVISLASIAGILVGGQTGADWGKHAKAIEAESAKMDRAFNLVKHFSSDGISETEVEGVLNQIKAINESSKKD